MANLSQQKRQRMLVFLQTIREEHKDDDDVLIALGEIESELNAKKYGLVWEQHEEAVDVQMQDNIPVFTEYMDKEISSAAGGVYQNVDFDTISISPLRQGMAGKGLAISTFMASRWSGTRCEGSIISIIF